MQDASRPSRRPRRTSPRLKFRTPIRWGAANSQFVKAAATSGPRSGISPDLPVCEDCLRELFDQADRRHFYPYINCTNCGPRYTVILGLPYDRANTTMQLWPLDGYCAAEYNDPGDRRFHAQPVACPQCGPEYYLETGEKTIRGKSSERSIRTAAAITARRQDSSDQRTGRLSPCVRCKERTAPSKRCGERKYRKEKPFALMTKNLDAQAFGHISVSPETEALCRRRRRGLL